MHLQVIKTQEELSRQKENYSYDIISDTQFNTDYFKSPEYVWNIIYCRIKCTQRIYKEASKILMGEKKSAMVIVTFTV